MWKTFLEPGAPVAAVTSPAAGGGGTIGGWQPSVLAMFGLVIAEIALAAFLSKHLLKG